MGVTEEKGERTYWVKVSQVQARYPVLTVVVLLVVFVGTLRALLEAPLSDAVYLLCLPSSECVILGGGTKKVRSSCSDLVDSRVTKMARVVCAYVRGTYIIFTHASKRDEGISNKLPRCVLCPLYLHY